MSSYKAIQAQGPWKINRFYDEKPQGDTNNGSKKDSIMLITVRV